MKKDKCVSLEEVGWGQPLTSEFGEILLGSAEKLDLEKLTPEAVQQLAGLMKAGTTFNVRVDQSEGVKIKLNPSAKKLKPSQ